MNRINAITVGASAYEILDIVMNVQSLLAEPRKWAMLLLGISIVAAFVINIIKDLLNRKMQAEHSEDKVVADSTDISLATGDEEIGE